MKKKIIVLVIILSNFSLNYLFSQNLNDSIFKNVIKMDSGNTSQIGNCFLIDFPIGQTSDFLILFNNSHIPNNFFFNSSTFKINSKEFILISPDFEYYNAVANNIKGTNIICAEPATSNKLYKIKRENSKLIIDSITVKGNKQPIVYFKNQQKIKNDSVLSYFAEKIKLSFLPKYTGRSLKLNQEEFVKKFEKDNNLKIEKTFSQHIKKDEYIYFYTLYNLNLINKLEFILEKSYDLMPDKHSKKITPPKGIYYPCSISLKNKVEVKK